MLAPLRLCEVEAFFVELYHWRNGFPIELATGDASFFDYHRFLPLGEALNNFHVSYPILKEFYSLTGWVLTFQDPAGDGYGVVHNEKDGETGQVAFLFEGEGVPNRDDEDDGHVLRRSRVYVGQARTSDGLLRVGGGGVSPESEHPILEGLSSVWSATPCRLGGCPSRPQIPVSPLTHGWACSRAEHCR